MSLGARIAERRKALGITQIELAHRLSTPEQKTDSVMISRWERGVVPHLDMVPRLAEALDVSVQWLVTGVATGPNDPGAEQPTGTQG